MKKLMLSILLASSLFGDVYVEMSLKDYETPGRFAQLVAIIQTFLVQNEGVLEDIRIGVEAENFESFKNLQEGNTMRMIFVIKDFNFKDN